MYILAGIIIGILISILVVVSSRRYNLNEKIIKNTDKVFSQKAKIIETQSDLEKGIDNMLKTNEQI